MHALCTWLVLALFVSISKSTVTFLSPTKADSWTVGQTKSISWTQVTILDNPKENYLSVRLYQVFPNTTTAPFFAYLIQQAVPNTINVNPAGWPVELDTTSGLNSSISNRYILALYLESQTKLLAQSEVFTIQNNTAGATTTSILSGITSSSMSGSPSATDITSSATSLVPSIMMTSSATISSTSVTATPSATATAMMGTGVKVGIGVGVSCAIILGLAVGWFFAGWHKLRQNSILPTSASLYSNSQANTSYTSTQFSLKPLAPFSNSRISSQRMETPVTYELPASSKP